MQIKKQSKFSKFWLKVGDGFFDNDKDDFSDFNNNIYDISTGNNKNGNDKNSNDEDSNNKEQDDDNNNQ